MVCQHARNLAPFRKYHTDLDSFVRYSFASQANQTSYLFRGTLFEYTTKAVLAKALGQYGLGDLTKVGGAADNGIDLLGSWHSASAEFNVLVQCKSSQTKVAPRIWRELAGTQLRLNQAQSLPWLSILASPSVMTPKALAAFCAVDVPFMHCRIRQPPILYNSREGEAKCEPSVSDLLTVCVNRPAKDLFRKYSINSDLFCT